MEWTDEARRVANKNLDKSPKECIKILKVKMDASDETNRKILQVENMFHLQLVRENNNTQISLSFIDLDRKINSIIFHLKYLCDTLNGIPMNEVARYVRDGIEKKGESGFRKELIDLGKPETEIDIWFEFTRFSLKNKERSLDLDSIVNSIKRAFPFIYSYVSIAEKIDNKKFDSSIIKNVKKLSGEIDIFFISDKFMNQALTENSNIPYVDINESSGGS